MNRFSGKIGFAQDQEIKPGVWTEEITEKHYYGEVLMKSRKLELSGNVNDDINISNRISIIADPYAMDHFFKMRYIVFMGAKWKVTDVDASNYPRLILTCGGLYNG